MIFGGGRGEELEKGKRSAIKYIVNAILQGEQSVETLKRKAAKKFGLSEAVRNSDILANIPKSMRTDAIVRLLEKRPMRTLSGVTPIAVMIKPEGSCRHSCIYCPAAGTGPKSYTGYEPAALRARQAAFDPYEQVRLRLKHYIETGHPTDKCELIIMGGTFLQTPKRYKHCFIKALYDSLNKRKSNTLEQAKKRNEMAKHRAVGVTIETRPDVCESKEIDEMLSYGATRVELGVQHPDNAIYRLIKRGHCVRDVIDATKRLKDSAFKVCYHLMPGLPGSNPKKDIVILKKLFSDERFRPDMLKIYPALVMPGTGLHAMMKQGKYTPYSSEKAAEVISEFYRHIQKYARVMRIQRDIPSGLIAEGAKKSNLRELVEQRVMKKNIKAWEIRTREIGLLGEEFVKSEFDITSLEYEASGGKEIFLSFENKKGLLAGFLRMRLPDNTVHRKEINKKTALVRELHVYGKEALIRANGAVQHRGIGSGLLIEAEKIAKEEFEKNNIIIISGVGTREYYRKKGYKLTGPYMAKAI